MQIISRWEVNSQEVLDVIVCFCSLSKQQGVMLTVTKGGNLWPLALSGNPVNSCYFQRKQKTIKIIKNLKDPHINNCSILHLLTTLCQQLETSVLVLQAYILKKGRLFLDRFILLALLQKVKMSYYTPEVDFWLFITFGSNVLFKSFHPWETAKLKCKKE